MKLVKCDICGEIMEQNDSWEMSVTSVSGRIEDFLPVGSRIGFYPSDICKNCAYVITQNVLEMRNKNNGYKRQR